MAHVRLRTVDAFTDTPFTGNPAAVCVMPAPRDEAWMQNVAMEMNLSETAFLHPAEDGWSLRWLRLHQIRRTKKILALYSASEILKKFAT